MNGDEEVLQEDGGANRATTIVPTTARGLVPDPKGSATSHNGSEEIEQGGYPSEEPEPSPEEDTDD